MRGGGRVITKFLHHSSRTISDSLCRLENLTILGKSCKVVLLLEEREVTHITNREVEPKYV